MELILKCKNKYGKWVAVDMPEVDKISAEVLRSWVGKEAVVEFKDDRKTIYAFGCDEVKHILPQDKVLMDMESFCLFWCYRLLDMGLDTFSKIELREEREAIMAAEGESEEAIAEVIASRPDIYQQDEFVFPEDF